MQILADYQTNMESHLQEMRLFRVILLLGVGLFCLASGAQILSNLGKLMESLMYGYHNFSSIPSSYRLIFCALGIYGCYLYYGLLQENIYRYRTEEGEKFTFTFFLLFVQCLVNAVVGAFLVLINGRSSSEKPSKFYQMYVCIGSSYIMAMLFSNQALQYVSYPLQALGKSSKMVPVMFMGVLVRGKKYSWFEYACVGLITAGITLFQLFGNKKKLSSASTHSDEEQNFGIMLLLLSLFFDGVTGAFQDKLKDMKIACTPHESMTLTNTVAVFITFFCSLYTNQFVDGFTFCMKNTEILYRIAYFALMSAIGQHFIFLTVANFNSLILTTITTTRKFFTILLSVFINRNPLAIEQWGSVFLVLAGLVGEIFDKYTKSKKTQKTTTAKAEAEAKKGSGESHHQSNGSSNGTENNNKDKNL